MQQGDACPRALRCRLKDLGVVRGCGFLTIPQAHEGGYGGVKIANLSAILGLQCNTEKECIESRCKHLHVCG